MSGLTEEEKLKIREVEQAKMKAAQLQMISQVASQPQAQTSTGNAGIDSIIAAKRATNNANIGTKTASRAAQGFQVGGAPGAAVGGAIGLAEGLIGKKRAKKELEAKKRSALADIEDKKQQQISGGIQSMIQNLRSIL